MLVLLSPAKKLNEEKQLTDNCTNPIFVEESEKLIKSLRKYSPKKLGALMKLSLTLSELNVNRYSVWDLDHSKDVSPAALMFNGEVYAGLDAKSFSATEKKQAQNHLRILSGLYGLLKPYDLVHPYRLEMGTKLKTGRKNNLYEFWGDKIVDEVNAITASYKEEVLVNLASNEYFKALESKKLTTRIITPVFKDAKNGQYKIISFYAKKARGLMSRYIIDHRINDPEQLKNFDSEGYRFSVEMSEGDDWVFIRDHAE